MWFGVVSLFPEMFQALQSGITGRALKEKLLTLQLWNPRDYATDKHKSVDDHPYGGGAGMLMSPEPLQAAIQAAKAAAPFAPRVIYLSPQGQHFNQTTAEYAIQHHPAIILIAGRYEGIDERIIESEVDEEWSIGDYILSGGELAAMTCIDVMTRLIPGAIHDEQSVTQDSLTTGLLKYPQYTRPDIFQGIPTPSVLLSGHHQAIQKWRLKASLGRTWLKRPDLLDKKELNSVEKTLLTEFIDEFMQKKIEK